MLMFMQRALLGFLNFANFNGNDCAANLLKELFIIISNRVFAHGLGLGFSTHQMIFLCEK